MLGFKLPTRKHLLHWSLHFDYILTAGFLGIQNDPFFFIFRFNQSSSHELISMFSLSSEGKMKSPDFHCPYPKLPRSVSRSRGKHYRSRKWKEGEHEVISLDKQHPIR